MAKISKSKFPLLLRSGEKQANKWGWEGFLVYSGPVEVSGPSFSKKTGKFKNCKEIVCLAYSGKICPVHKRVIHPPFSAIPT